MSDWLRNKTSTNYDSSSDSVTPKGLRSHNNPALPTGQREIVDGKGVRAGVVKRVGSQWVGDWDQFSEKHDSFQQALLSLDSQYLGK